MCGALALLCSRVFTGTCSSGAPATSTYLDRLESFGPDGDAAFAPREPFSFFAIQLGMVRVFPCLNILTPAMCMYLLHGYYIAARPPVPTVHTDRSHRGEAPTLAKEWPCGPRWWW